MARDLYNRAPASMEEENEFRSFAAVQNSFINRVFGWMSVGLAVTGVTAWYVANHYLVRSPCQKVCPRRRGLSGSRPCSRPLCYFCG